MPEYEEVLGCFLTLERWFQSVSEDSRALIQLWADEIPSSEDTHDSTDASPHKTVELNLVGEHPLRPPPPWSGADARPLYELRLAGIQASPRAVLLDFKRVWLQVEIHSHVIIQAYTQAQWYLEVLEAEHKRDFSVGLALDFGVAGVIAFLTPDDRTELCADWATTSDLLPRKARDVYVDYGCFIGAVAKWITGRRQSSRSAARQLAISAILEAELVFGGMGPCTANEVFFLAGLSPFLLEYELFSSPSRVARLCEAFWQFAHNAHTTLSSFLQPMYHGSVLSATKNQRELYASRLRIHSKRTAKTSARMCKMRTEYLDTLRLCVNDPNMYYLFTNIGYLFDPFEPTLIKDALCKPSVSLGHLVFGWIEWWFHTRISHKTLDPLSTTFRALGVPTDARTFLQLPRYRGRLYLDDTDASAADIEVQLYRGPQTLWTIMPRLPGGVHYRLIADSRPHTFHHIVRETEGYAVGPLEHCAVAQIADDVEKAGPRSSACRDVPDAPPCQTTGETPEHASPTPLRNEARRREPTGVVLNSSVGGQIEGERPPVPLKRRRSAERHIIDANGPVRKRTRTGTDCSSSDTSDSRNSEVEVVSGPCYKTAGKFGSADQPIIIDDD